MGNKALLLTFLVLASSKPLPDLFAVLVYIVETFFSFLHDDTQQDI